VKIYANEDTAEKWFRQDTLEGVAFEYDISLFAMLLIKLAVCWTLHAGRWFASYSEPGLRNPRSAFRISTARPASAAACHDRPKFPTADQGCSIVGVPAGTATP
jgi:hypothetical protein